MATPQNVHVIVGGLGFLGRALQQQLLSHGKQVRVLDLAPSAVEAATRLVHPTSIEYMPCDLSSNNNTALKSALHDAETVYSIVTSDVLKSSAADMRRANVDGLSNLLDACQQVGVPKLVYGSSMGVTNQLVEHCEENEETPLPPWDTYKIAYDRTKRQGEEIVLKAHSANLQTCSLRLGTILAGPGDYGTRKFLESPGRVIVPSASHCQPMDMISSHDLATVFSLASDKLDSSSSGVGGKAIFVTKCKTNRPSSVDKTMAKYADEFQWPLYQLPSFVLPTLAQGYRTLRTAKGLFRSHDEESTPGLPFDCMVESMEYEFTFDNSLAKKLLDFEPQETWEDAVERIAREFRLLYPELFKK